MKHKSDHIQSSPSRPVHPIPGQESDTNKPHTTYPPQRTPVPGTPSEERQQAAKVRILEEVNGWLESRIDEVFEMADEDQEAEFGDRITWRDLNEVRWQICGCLADSLEHDLGDQVEEIMGGELVTRTSFCDIRR